MAEALDAGLTFQAYAESAAVRTLPTSMVETLRVDAGAGKAISESLEKLRLLDGSSSALLAAAEHRGETPEALRVLARREAETREVAHRILRRLTYPCLILIAAAVLFPLPKLFTSGFGAYAAGVIDPLWPFAIVAFLFGVVYPRLDPDSKVRVFMHEIGARVPPFAQISRHLAQATFADVLGSCLGAGLPMRRSLALATGATPHPEFAGSADALIKEIDSGATLVDALERTIPKLPPDYLALVGHGEKVGKLVENLGRLCADEKATAHRLITTVIIIVGAIASIAVVYQVISGLIAGYAGYFNALDGSIDQMMR